MIKAYFFPEKSIFLFDYSKVLTLEDVVLARKMRYSFKEKHPQMIIITNYNEPGSLADSTIPFQVAKWVREDADHIAEVSTCGIRGMKRIFYKTYISFFKRNEKPIHRDFRTLEDAAKHYAFHFPDDFEEIAVSNLK